MRVSPPLGSANSTQLHCARAFAPEPSESRGTFRDSILRPPLILCYHSVRSLRRADDTYGLCVSPFRFHSQLSILRRCGYRFVTFSTIARQSLQHPLSGVVAVTFDDGFEDLVEMALPIMQRLGVVGTAFIPVGLLGRPHPDLSSATLVDAPAVRRLHDHGFEIGSHGMFHRDFTAMLPSEAQDRLADSKAHLEAITGAPVSSLSYPFGRNNARVRALAKEVGYNAACGADGRWEDMFCLPRQPIGATGVVRAWSAGHTTAWAWARKLARH